MKKIFIFAVLSCCIFSLFGAKLDRSSPTALLESWLKAVCNNDSTSAWMALADKTQNAIRKEYSANGESLAEVRKNWLNDVRKGICNFANIKNPAELLADKEKMRRVLERYTQKISLTQVNGSWRLSSPEVEGQSFSSAMQNSRKNRAAPPQKPQNTAATAAVKSSSTQLQKSTSQSENTTLALKVIRAVFKKNADELWELIAPSNRAEILKKSKSEAAAKKETLFVLALGIAMKAPRGEDITNDLGAQMKLAEKFAENEDAFVIENGKCYIIAVKLPPQSK